jgi:hypothetical protein
MARDGSLLPAQLTHGTYWSWRHARPFVGHELLTAMGFHVLPETCGTFRSGITALFPSLSAKHVRSLAGNAMHLAAWASWMFYVLSNVKPVDDFYTFTRSPTSSCQEEADDVD